jgi:GTPase SAR1 family protein
MDVFLFCFDVTDKKTFENINKWIKDCVEFTKNSLKMLIGTNSELRNEKIETISYNEVIKIIINLLRG